MNYHNITKDDMLKARAGAEIGQRGSALPIEHYMGDVEIFDFTGAR